MINQIFWEMIAEGWGRKEEIEIPEIDPGPDLPLDDPVKDYIDFDSIDDVDDFLKDILSDL